LNQQTGKYIIIAGLCIVAIGVLVYFFHNAFKWFGNLPGDVKFSGKNVKVYFPIVTMILISVVLTILVNLFRKWF